MLADTCQSHKSHVRNIFPVRLDDVFGLFVVTLGWAFGRSTVLFLSLDGRRGFGLAARRRFGIMRVAKLTSLRPRIGGLRPRLASVPVDRQSFDRQRDQRGWRKWYKTTRWQKLRMSILLRDLFTCQWPGCGRVEADTSQLVADHRRPHRGDEALFWDERNLWCLCKACHDSAKQREERRGS